MAHISENNDLNNEIFSIQIEKASFINLLLIIIY